MAQNGVWTPLSELYPGQSLNAYDAKRSLCNIQTGDKGEPCFSSRACEGSCLAPPGAEPGDQAEGYCSSGILIPKGTLTIDKFSVSYPDKSTASYPAKIERLETLNSQKAKWENHDISDYELMINQECYCLYGPAYGPNKVTVKNNNVSIVRYYGEVRDGYTVGDRLDLDDGLSLSIAELFERAEQQIINATQNAELQIAYDPTYGFPALIAFDRPDWADEEYRIEVSGFKPR